MAKLPPIRAKLHKVLVLSLFGAFIEAGNKQKQKDGKLLSQKNTQSRETAQSTSG